MNRAEDQTEPDTSQRTTILPRRGGFLRKIISMGINNFMTPSKSILLITHYQRLLDYIKPNYVHVMQNGKIIKTGSAELAKKLEDKGYEWLK